MINCISPHMLIIIAFVALFSNQVLAEEDVGKTIYLKYQCQICHGEKGDAPAQTDFPKISGQTEKYLIVQIQDIRDGVRTNGKSHLMRPLIKRMTDEEIKLVSRFLSQ